MINLISVFCVYTKLETVSDILDLTLPKHSFIFMKKDIYNEKMPIKCISADEILKRNTDSLKSAVENDLFRTAPSVDCVYDIIS